MTVLDAESAALIAAQTLRERALAVRLGQEFGNLDAYRRILRRVEIDADDAPRLRDFYALYEGIFTLAEERESFEGFETVLRFNADLRLQAEFGPFRELVTLVYEPGRSGPVGAANFILYAYPTTLGGFQGSAQLNFLCVDEERRGAGIAGVLLADLDRRVAAFARAHARIAASKTFITCEQNNPERMTDEELRADARAALIDPHQRLSWWRARGYRKLDFPYRQPPLDPERKPCNYVDYFVRLQQEVGHTQSSIPSVVLVEHIRRYFYVSIGKFDFDMSKNPEWLLQIVILKRNNHINVL
ncbi:MAG: hypothetical protein ACHQAY_20240 [Hyphomicrobiales bacterium]